MSAVLDAARAGIAVGGTGLAVTAARDLRAAGEFRGDGVLSWRVVATAPGGGRATGWLMPWDRYRFVTGAKLAAGLAAPTALVLPRADAAALAWVLAVTAVVTLLRGGYGLDGSDQMATLSVLAGAGALSGDDGAGRLWLGFLAAQLVLGYVIAGLAKLVSPQWRDGSCLAMILSTTAYESRRLAGVLRRWPLVAAGLAWGVMLLEVLFWVGPVLGGWALWAVLAAGVLMHVGIAVTMRLTTFVFAFTSAYPALVVTAAWLR